MRFQHPNFQLQILHRALTGAKRACGAGGALLPQRLTHKLGCEKAQDALPAPNRPQKGYRPALLFQTLLLHPLRGCSEGEEGFKSEPENEREKGKVSAGCSEMEGFVFSEIKGARGLFVLNALPGMKVNRAQLGRGVRATSRTIFSPVRY